MSGYTANAKGHEQASQPARIQVVTSLKNSAFLYYILTKKGPFSALAGGEPQEGPSGRLLQNSQNEREHETVHFLKLLDSKNEQTSKNTRLMHFSSF